ncbi:L,D-transpeptidase [Desulfosporosinus meridiei]|uniref:L,D-TPase catalytic domain-containing protein n=1 Tax=Desulfosporosinus meridiei (strain ATCC BAA-275 / DSM 13257 / KCTC 12902 / NCIMB 13706 / S10) TaxID=768704 RepID=J7ITY0_DESMD|nr:L,D-transpeptidase [Desulfosporosinus meridiei]AFQ42151.1 hypothetical protein Desmer_0047 [Desulfosporosinus meridiei DSM 13257]
MPNYQIYIYTASRLLELYKDNQRIRSYPIAVGKKSTPTPPGNYYIATKTMQPGGVFGTRWLGLSIPYYGIHGTNNPMSIGQAVSKGCIRMYNHDVEELYQIIETETPVIIQA